MNVLVIGDSCIDEFVYGKVDRMSPEAPVPVFQPVKKTSKRLINRFLIYMGKQFFEGLGHFRF